MATFFGMRGTGDWATNQRPENWRQVVLHDYPNGSAPLVAVTSMLGSEKVDDPIFHWWEKSLPVQGGSFTAGEIYTETGLGSAYASGGVAGDTVYVKVAESIADHFRVGHNALMRDQSDWTVDVVGFVTDVVKNGVSSYIAVKLLEADDNSSYSHDLSDADYILVCGNSNAEGAEMPEPIAYDPTERSNYTEIWRTPISLTRTALATRLRTGDHLKEAKREGLELHSMEMENSFIFGVKSTSTDPTNGKIRRTTMGLLTAIRTYASSNVTDFTLETDSQYDNKTWLQAGELWLDNYLEVIFRKGSNRKMMLAGNGVLLGINRLAKAGGQLELKARTIAYGLDCHEWITPFGTLYVKTHPLFNHYATCRYMGLIFEPPDLKFRYIDDTMYIPDKTRQTGGHTRIDGIEEEWLTEGGLEFHHMERCGAMNGFNQDNP